MSTKLLFNWGINKGLYYCFPSVWFCMLFSIQNTEILLSMNNIEICLTWKFALHACLFLTSSLLPAGDWALSDSCKSCSDVCLKGGHSQGLVVSLFCCKNSPNLSLYLKRMTCTFQRPSCKRQRREKKVTVTGKRKTPQVTRSVSLYLFLAPPLLSPHSFSLLSPSLNT